MCNIHIKCLLMPTCSCPMEIFQTLYAQRFQPQNLLNIISKVLIRIIINILKFKNYFYIYIFRNFCRYLTKGFTYVAEGIWRIHFTNHLRYIKK